MNIPLRYVTPLALLAACGWGLFVLSVYECRKPTAAPLPVEVEKVVFRDHVVEKKVPGATKQVLVGGECRDWEDEHERFKFDQKKRALEVHQAFRARINAERNKATITEVSPKTGEPLSTQEVPLPNMIVVKPAPKFRLEGGAYLRDDAHWGGFVRGTYKPSRFTFVSVEKSDDYRIYGGLAFEF